MTRTKTLKDRLYGLALVLAAAAVLGLLTTIGQAAGEAGFMLGGAAVGTLLLAAAIVTTKPPE